MSVKGKILINIYLPTWEQFALASNHILWVKSTGNAESTNDLSNGKRFGR
jgi:hypothetical protein